MLVLEPARSVVPVVVARLEAEVTDFVAGLSCGEEPLSDADASEHAAYVAALRQGHAGLGRRGCWTVFEGESRHALAFMLDAATSALREREWEALGFYAECLRRLDAVS